MTLKFKVGDRVQVKSTLEEGHGFSCYVNKEMVLLKRQIFTIESIDSSSRYHFKGLRWVWTDDMLEEKILKPTYTKELQKVIDSIVEELS